MTWLAENWMWLLPLVVAGLSAINRMTDHWSEVEGPWWKRLLLVAPLFLLDLASVLRSKGSASLTKLPGTVELKKDNPRSTSTTTLLVVLLAGSCLGISGCGTWKTTTLRTTATVMRGADGMHAGLEKVCKPTVKLCRDQGCNDLKCCPKLQACFDMRTKALKGLDAIQRSSMLAIVAVETSDQPTAMKAVTALLEVYKQVVEGLKTWGVDTSAWRL